MAALDFGILWGNAQRLIVSPQEIQERHSFLELDVQPYGWHQYRTAIAVVSWICNVLKID